MTIDYTQFTAEIIQMKDHDLMVRQRLVDTGELYKGYNPEMEAVHLKNARQLESIIQQIGWPSKEKVGTEARDAAMIIVQHAISFPEFQRICLHHIEAAVKDGKEDKRNYAFLYDRICFNERRPQKFGTQYDWDENGQLSPWTVENPEKVNDLRKEVGLNSIEEETEAVRKGAKTNNEKPPTNFESRQMEIYRWSKRIGWVN